MIKRKYILLVVFVLGTACFVCVLSKESVGEQQVPASTQPANSANAKWEYRILTCPLSNAMGLERRTETYQYRGKTQTYLAPPSLEIQIKELADQGYEIQSFQALSPITAKGDTYSGLSVGSEPTIVVLFKLMKK
jgi:hypothetical protein